MNRKEAVLSLLDTSTKPACVPAAFFIHFDEPFHRGRAAVDKHLEYFEHTGMDMMKVQYEDRFPHRPEILDPADWTRLPIYALDFYDNQLEILSGLIDAMCGDAVVIQTIYSPFMQASTTVGRDRLKAHIEQDPEALKEGMARITESMMGYVKACIELGVDGFYASTQGGEAAMFGGLPLFEECIKPYDLALMREMDRRCAFNILHICDFHGPYHDLTPFLDYPGHVVSTPLHGGSAGTSLTALSDLFGRPIMGGLDRHGVIATGSRADIAAEVRRVLAVAPERFALGADCTLPGDVSWESIRIAIAAAHNLR